MFPKVILMILMIYVTLLHGLPPPIAKNSEAINQSPPLGDLRLMHPHIITIERLEALLRRASEIFKPNNARQIDLPSSESQQQITVPIQYMQPPNQPYNFYLPLFDYDESDDASQKKRDTKHNKMEHFVPPPKPKDGVNTNNFNDKPKKSPKKFSAANKHINIKWLNNYEKQLTSPNNKQSVNIPKDVYYVNDERNRINFDDSFFSVDMKVPDRTNKLEKPQSDAAHNEDDSNQGEDDLIAQAADLPLLRDFTSSRRI